MFAKPSAAPQAVIQKSKNSQNAFLVRLDRMTEAVAKRNVRLEARVRPYAGNVEEAW